MSNALQLITGVVLDKNVQFTPIERCYLGESNAEYIIELVEKGLLEPVGSSTPEWRFYSTTLKRLQKTIHLQRDLRVNLAGTALALDLLDEVEKLRRKP